MVDESTKEQIVALTVDIGGILQGAREGLVARQAQLERFRFSERLVSWHYRQLQATPASPTGRAWPVEMI